MQIFNNNSVLNKKVPILFNTETKKAISECYCLVNACFHLHFLVDAVAVQSDGAALLRHDGDALHLAVLPSHVELEATSGAYAFDISVGPCCG